MFEMLMQKLRESSPQPRHPSMGSPEQASNATLDETELEKQIAELSVEDQDDLIKKLIHEITLRDDDYRKLSQKKTASSA